MSSEILFTSCDNGERRRRLRISGCRELEAAAAAAAVVVVVVVVAAAFIVTA